MNTQDDNIFKEVVKILNDNKINYWICHGTLLGIVRENRLLPWDHDIDFAIWDDEYSKEDILELFKDNSKFQQTIVPEEMSNLHFLAADKRVDMNFYSRDKEKAYIRWVAPEGVILRTYYFSVNYINSNFGIKCTTESSNKAARLVKILLASILFFIRLIFPKSIKRALYDDLQNRLDYTGYSYLLDLMKFKKIFFLNVGIFIPVESEKMLEVTYGEDWKTPKQDYIWHKEAKNLLSQP